MNAAAARNALTSNSTISIGLAVTIVAAAISVGIGWQRLDAHAEELSEHDQRIKILEENQTRGIVIQGQLTDLLEKQQADQERADDEIDAVNREVLQLRFLIDQLRRPGGSVGGSPPP